MTAHTAEQDAQIAELRARARADLPLVNRYPLTIRYAREFGWLLVRDPFSGEWLEIKSSDAPSSWRRAAHMDKQARRLENA